MSKKNKLNARQRCASISLSLLHTQGLQTLTNKKMQNKPNPRTPAACRAPKTQNEPNLSPAAPRFRKTNPIYASRPTIYRPYTPIPQNEPNFPVRAVREPSLPRKTNPISQSTLLFLLSPLSQATGRAAQLPHNIQSPFPLGPSVKMTTHLRISRMCPKSKGLLI